MTQHFLLSSRAKTLSVVQVLKMTDQECEDTFGQIRWQDSGGEPYCPHCDCFGFMVLSARAKKEGQKEKHVLTRYRCKAKECRKDYTVTSGTLFASAKLPMQYYLLAIVIFCNEIKGKSALGHTKHVAYFRKA